MDLNFRNITSQATPPLHQPERGEYESQEQYRARRLAAKAAVRQVTAHAVNKGLVNSRVALRDSMRKSGTMGLRTRASDALMAAWASKRVTKTKRRDQHGAYTLVGSAYDVYGAHPDETREHVLGGGQDDGVPFYTARRIWLAGISAQRGY